MGILDGKIAFITGAARGQGRAHAVTMAEEGAEIIAIDIDEPIDDVAYSHATAADLAETVAQVEAADRRILAKNADVRSQAALDAVVAEGLAMFGRIDVVVANAGIYTQAPFWEMSEKMWDDVHRQRGGLARLGRGVCGDRSEHRRRRRPHDHAGLQPGADRVAVAGRTHRHHRYREAPPGRRCLSVFVEPL